MTCAHEHQSLVGYSGDFTTAAEAARIHLRTFKNLADLFTTKRHNYGGFSAGFPSENTY
jgi:hypothetical protein